MLKSTSAVAQIDISLFVFPDPAVLGIPVATYGYITAYALVQEYFIPQIAHQMVLVQFPFARLGCTGMCQQIRLSIHFNFQLYGPRKNTFCHLLQIDLRQSFPKHLKRIVRIWLQKCTVFLLPAIVPENIVGQPVIVVSTNYRALFSQPQHLEVYTHRVRMILAPVKQITQQIQMILLCEIDFLQKLRKPPVVIMNIRDNICLLYTSDAADEL